ncbi:MAG: aminotransferase class IV [Candidatus Omnitrophica bacterium]|nr:aminotransferase class IV [Candidatus Omnitrophota bacterium]
MKNGKLQNYIAYVDGKFVPQTEAKISIYDSALMFGDMVFEMMRTFNHEHFLLDEHLERLYAGMKFLKIPEPMSRLEMKKLYNETMEKNADFFDEKEEMRPLINVSRGILPIYQDVYGQALKPNLVISVFPLRWTIGATYPNYLNGISMYVASQRAIPADLLEPKVKNRSRMHYQLANLEMREIGPHAWALLLDTDGFIAEGTGSNIFLVKNGKIYTPEGRNVLRGITRRYVMSLAEELKISCEEKNLNVYDLYQADEAFVTSTPYCIVPVTKINGVAIGNGKPGPMVTKLLDFWNKKVGVDIVGQVKYYSETGTQSSSNPFVELKR